MTSIFPSSMAAPSLSSSPDLPNHQNEAPSSPWFHFTTPLIIQRPQADVGEGPHASKLQSPFPILFSLPSLISSHQVPREVTLAIPRHGPEVTPHWNMHRQAIHPLLTSSSTTVDGSLQRDCIQPLQNLKVRIPLLAQI